MILTTFVAQNIFERFTRTIKKVLGERKQRPHAKNETNESSSFGSGYNFAIIYAQIQNEVLTEGKKVLNIIDVAF